LIHPALRVRTSAPDLVLAAVDDFQPAALDERDDCIRIFFAAGHARDAAHAALSAAGFDVEPLDVDDEDWARRSQENLEPVTIDRITVSPPWAAPRTPHPAPRALLPAPIRIVINPSMGFGTGHHATTRLCLRELQNLPLAGRSVLDVGTGSGILAIAAARLGARRVVAIDSDADAIENARENVALNGDLEGIDLRVADIAQATLPPADVVLANITAAALIALADRLLALVNPSGTLIVSGILDEQAGGVRGAFAAAGAGAERHEDGWASIVFTLPATEPPLV